MGELELRDLVPWPRSWLSEWPLPRESSPTTRSSTTRPARESSRTSSSNSTRDSSFPTPEDASQRSSEVKVPELDSRNLTDELPSCCFTQFTLLPPIHNRVVCTKNCLKCLCEIASSALMNAVNQGWRK